MAERQVLKLKARAKLNLFLGVTGKVGEKHSLDTLIVPVELYDDVYMEKADGVEISYDGKPSPYETDTVKKAVNLLKGRYFDGGVRINVIKRIPERAGVGGSSADAAAVVRGLEKLYGFTADAAVIAEIGSDVYPMYLDCPCRLKGVGKEVEKVAIPDGMKFVLVETGKGVSTKLCFDLYDSVGGENPDGDEIMKKLSAREYFTPINALYDGAVKSVPEIKDASDALSKAGFRCGMTGSGSGTFGYEYDEKVFEEKLSALKKSVGKKYRITTF